MVAMARAADVSYPWQRCKIIHLVRHGEAIHNVEGDKNREALLSPDLFDAELSSLGLQQVAKLRKDFHDSGLLRRIGLVITSPLSRAMQTAVGVFGSEGHKNSPKVMAVELCRDRLGVRPCDMRRKVSECLSRFPSIDFSMIDDEDDNLWKPDTREQVEELAARVAKFLKWLWTRPEKEIVVVSHGLVLQTIINILGNNNDCKRFRHCEARSVYVMGMDSPSLLLCSHQFFQENHVVATKFPTKLWPSWGVSPVWPLPSGCLNFQLLFFNSSIFFLPNPDVVLFFFFLDKS